MLWWLASQSAWIKRVWEVKKMMSDLTVAGRAVGIPLDFSRFEKVYTYHRVGFMPKYA